jgi:hypothetical protein
MHCTVERLSDEKQRRLRHVPVLDQIVPFEHLARRSGATLLVLQMMGRDPGSYIDIVDDGPKPL